MSLLDFVYEEKPLDPGITERFFECQRDGLTIRGAEYRPAGGDLPIAIVSHGFMAFQDTVREYTMLLAQLGYAAYCFDFCGGCVGKRGKSDGSSTQMSVLTEARDLETVIAYARSLPYTGDELLLMGASQGGFVSSLVAARRAHSTYAAQDPGRVKLVIIDKGGHGFKKAHDAIAMKELADFSAPNK